MPTRPLVTLILLIYFDFIHFRVGRGMEPFYRRGRGWLFGCWWFSLERYGDQADACEKAYRPGVKQRPAWLDFGFIVYDCDEDKPAYD